MKTKEELQILKQEYDSLKNKVQELNNEELLEISGGMAAYQEAIKQLEEAGQLTEEKKTELYERLIEELKKAGDNTLSILIGSVFPKNND